MSNAVTSRTFHNRHSKCYFYNEKNNYIKYIDIFFFKLLKQFSSDQKFLDCFSSKFNSVKYTGPKFIHFETRQLYKNICIKCAVNMDKFLSSISLEKIMDTVTYKDKVKCYIGGTIKDKPINVHFCFRPIKEMEKELDFYLLNNYIYNICRGVKNDCLIFNAQDDMYNLVRYEESYYTTKRGFLKSIITNRIRKQGEHCITCKNSCKPIFINGLSRLVSIV